MIGLLVELGAVLMLLGFMSLLLAATQGSISKICIPSSLADTMLPCRKQFPTKTTKSLGSDQTFAGPYPAWEKVERRLASGGEGPDYCDSKVNNSRAAITSDY